MLTEQNRHHFVKNKSLQLGLTAVVFLFLFFWNEPHGAYNGKSQVIHRVMNSNIDWSDILNRPNEHSDGVPLFRSLNYGKESNLTLCVFQGILPTSKHQNIVVSISCKLCLQIILEIIECLLSFLCIICTRPY